MRHVKRIPCKRQDFSKHRRTYFGISIFLHFGYKFSNLDEERRVGRKVYYPADFLLYHGLDPIGDVKLNVVNCENTFEYSTGKEPFNSLHDLAASHRTEIYLFNLIESASIEITPSVWDIYIQNILKYNRKDICTLRLSADFSGYEDVNLTNVDGLGTPYHHLTFQQTQFDD
ncbi:hypothetical protein RF11_13149 [Thelohanellus kitauei]|uniref:Uncharacterized protein n=1 Tax=Thelohanellus kitauei TaxID=669202 RepID=A0A0C2NAQ4_THEKT|nr:hypothetical protein RF11_13149 [Thelohanellus kitauei]